MPPSFHYSTAPFFHMKTKDFIRLGVPLGEATRRATDFITKFILSGGDMSRLEEEVKGIVAHPSASAGDNVQGDFDRASRRESRLRFGPARGNSGSGGRSLGSDFRRELFKLSLKARHLFQRS